LPRSDGFSRRDGRYRRIAVSSNLIRFYVTGCFESAGDCRRIPSSRKMSATRSSCLGLSRARKWRYTRPLLLESSNKHIDSIYTPEPSGCCDIFAPAIGSWRDEPPSER
jgi:hypothetical protein